MRKLSSPLHLVLLGLGAMLCVVIGLGSHALPPQGQGQWVASSENDCDTGYLCAKWDIQGMPPDDQCCIPEGSLFDDDPLACRTNLRHDLH